MDIFRTKYPVRMTRAIAVIVEDLCDWRVRKLTDVGKFVEISELAELKELSES